MINLLPTEKKQSADTKRTISLITRVAFAVGFLVILEGAIGVGILFLLNSNLQKATQKHDNLTAQISALQSTEQNLVLIKDRLQKISVAFESRRVYESLAKYNQIIDALPLGSSLTEIKLSSDSSSMRVASADSTQVSDLITQLSDPGKFDYSLLKNLSFNSLQGFQIEANAN